METVRTSVPATRRKKADLGPQIATRVSSRTIKKKTLGPDYILDFNGRGSLGPLSTSPNPLPASSTRRSAALASAARKTPEGGSQYGGGGHHPPRQQNFGAAKRPKQQQEPVQRGLQAAFQDGLRNMCSECLKRRPDGLIRCTGRECSYAAHAECLKFSADTVALVRNRFKCDSCKRCTTCGKGTLGNDLSLRHCVRCDLIYHLRCHSPSTDDMQEESTTLRTSGWMCGSCKSGRKRIPDHSGAYAEFGQNGEELSNSSDGWRDRGSVTSGDESSSSHSTELGNGGAYIENANDDECHLPVRHLPGRHLPAPLAAPGTPYTEDPSKNGHDYFVTTVAPGMEEELELALEKKKEDADRRLRQELSRMTTEECARHFTDINPDLCQLIRKHGLYGSSLVILSRPQFIDLFGLTLGAALKMHDAVCRWRKAFF
ncbi:hypothetical protein BV898_12011 [Hypsibius exemplaris]|uniref:PHD-type domain-containing protein n=1 Tax=Hypsibius exemplaris TaxID=2072580 RepID=A0A1W0WF34_HYPEX|nr:hypothetical protein BV898_12011 [Hypsibius exemplaris]